MPLGPALSGAERPQDGRRGLSLLLLLFRSSAASSPLSEILSWPLLGRPRAGRSLRCSCTALCGICHRPVSGSWTPSSSPALSICVTRRRKRRKTLAFSGGV